MFQVLHNIGLSWLTRPRWSQLALKTISRGNESSTSRWRRPTIFYEMWSLSISQGTLSSPIWAGLQFTFKFVTTHLKTFINVAIGQLISKIALFWLQLLDSLLCYLLFRQRYLTEKYCPNLFLNSGLLQSLDSLLCLLLFRQRYSNNCEGAQGLLYELETWSSII